MEVHHHTHHPKRWKEYFWEFFMLFLAVFCGFLAEYQLEHKIEKDRARKYMKDMVENLKYDTVRLGRNFRRNTMKCQYLDSFRNEIQLALEGKNNVNQLYYYWIKTKSYNYVAFNKSTVTQLKNSGGFRLITNNNLATLIGDYYERIILATENQVRALDEVEQRLNVFSLQIFSYVPFNNLLSGDNYSFRPDSSDDRRFNQMVDSVVAYKQLNLMTKNQRDLLSLYNHVSNKEIELKNLLGYFTWAHKEATRLAQKIESEYH